MSDRPQQVPPRGQQYGNFRPSVSERAESKKRPSAQERREGNSAAHLAFIRRLPCCACLKDNGKNDPHHLKSGPAKSERGFGMRSTDKWSTPLCRTHHNQIEIAGVRRELDQFQAWGIEDPFTLAKALTDASPDVDRGRAIVFAHQKKIKPRTPRAAKP